MLKDQINLQLAFIEYSKNNSLRCIVKALVKGKHIVGYKFLHNVCKQPVNTNPETLTLLVEFFRKEGGELWI